MTEVIIYLSQKISNVLMYEMGNGNEMNKNVTFSNWGTFEDFPLSLYLKKILSREIKPWVDNLKVLT